MVKGRSRINKYAAKIDGDIAKQRYDATKDLAVYKFSRSVDRQVEIEVQVKSICDGVSTMLLPYYIIFAKELNKINTWTERNIFYNKWGQRGLNWLLLLKIENWLFGMAPELRVPVAVEGREAHIPFFETSGTMARDVSGNGHNGTIVDPTHVLGKVGNCLSHNGTTTKTPLANLTALYYNNDNDFTWTMWYYATAAEGAWEYLFGIGDQMGFGRHPIGAPDKFVFTCRNNSGGTNTINFSEIFHLNRWVFVAFKREGNNLKLYIDGVWVKTKALPDGIQTFSDTTIISISPQRYFTGLIDEVIVYHKILTDPEILEYYNLTKNYGHE